jgi:hypothetical protein
MFNKFACGVIMGVSLFSLGANAEAGEKVFHCPIGDVLKFQFENVNADVVLDKTVTDDGWRNATKKHEVEGPFSLKPTLTLYRITIHPHEDGDSLWCQYDYSLGGEVEKDKAIYLIQETDYTDCNPEKKEGKNTGNIKCDTKIDSRK